MASSIFIDQSGFTFSGSGTTFPTPGLFPDGTAGAPSMSFASDPADGLWRGPGNNLATAIDGVTIAAWYADASAPGLQLKSTYNLSWASGNINSASDTTLARSAAGKVVLTGTTPMLQLGGTTASFPALKQSGANLNLRVGDDTANTGLAVANLHVGASVLFPGTGFVQFTSGLRDGTSGNILVSQTAPTISSGFAASGTTLTPNNGTAAFVINVGATTPGSSGVIGLPAAANGWNCYVTDITGAAAHVGLHTVQTGSTTASVTVESQNAAGVATAWAGNSILRVSCFAY
jgi:hypothetical protein